MTWDEELDDEEWIEDEGADDSDAQLLQCPACGKPVHEDTQQCPFCGDWIIAAHAEKPWKRLVWAVTAVLVIISMILFTLL